MSDQLDSSTFRPAPGRLARIWAMTERDLAFMCAGSRYGWVIVASSVEGLVLLLCFYFGGTELTNAVAANPVQYVIPGLLAMTILDGAWAENLSTFFGKHEFARLYVSIQRTPLSPRDIAYGELLVGVFRIAFQSALFLGVLLVLGAIEPARFPLLFAAALGCGMVFGATGMVIGCVIRSWEDFDYVSAAQFTLVFVSGVYFPVSQFPVWLHEVCLASPLYHAVELLREIYDGSPPDLTHVIFLFLFGSVAIVLMSWRVNRVLPRPHQ